MKTFDKVLAVVMVVLLLAVAITFGLIRSVRAATQVDLGTADDFAILAGTAVTNVPTSVITGDVGLSPAAGSFYDDGVTAAQVAGTIYAVDDFGPAGSVNNPGLLTTAKNDLITAYDDAAGQTPTTTFVETDNQLGGKTLIPGVYRFGHGDNANLTAASPLTLDAQSDPNAVFIFQATSDLRTASGSVVRLVNGAQACHVFWQVTSSATLGTYSTFKGTIMALTSITVTTGANVEGRVLARNAAGTLDQSIITRAICEAAPLISIEKVPTPLTLPNGPGSVTYNYTVRNIGPFAMSNVTVIDDKCATVDFISGDTNDDSRLDPDETWYYRCITTLSETTTNTVTVTGQAEGLTATGTANATVVVISPNGVTSPQLPYTGK